MGLWDEALLWRELGSLSRESPALGTVAPVSRTASVRSVALWWRMHGQKTSKGGGRSWLEPERGDRGASECRDGHLNHPYGRPCLAKPRPKGAPVIYWMLARGY